MPKTALERQIDSGSVLRGGGGVAGGGLGALPYHNTLPGLTVGDPHPQYLTPERGAGLFVPLARQILAGEGLAGGGALNLDRTLGLASSVAGPGLTYTSGVLAVGTAGLGLSVEADVVRLTTSANPGVAAKVLATDSDGLVTLAALNLGAAMYFSSSGNIASAPDILFTSNAILAAENSLYISIDSDNSGGGAALIVGHDAPTTAGFLELFRFDEAGAATIAGKVRTPLIDATGDLTVQPAGDLILNPGASDVLPGGSVEDDLGDYNRKWRTLYAAELYVETLVAQDVLSTIGGRIEVTPTTTLIADLAAAATTMDVKHSGLRNGEYAYLMTAPGGVAQFEAIQVVSAATAITGGYRYSITRNLDGTGANAWVAGDAIASLAKNVGEGHISLTATSTVYNHLGPTVTIYSRTNTGAWNAVTPVVALGNLESFAGYSAPAMGLAIGNNLTLTPTTGFKGLTADAANGLRMFSTAISTYNGATQTFYLAPTGLEFWLGPSAADKRLTWDGSTLGIVGNVTATAGYIGGWSIGTGLISSNGIRLYSGNVYTARLEVGDGVTDAKTAGVIGDDGAGTSPAFWAGKTATYRGTAPYRVYHDGALYAANATIYGTLISTNASFGDLMIDTNGCYIDAPTTWNLTTKGYKFKFGGAAASGMTATYNAGTGSVLSLTNNASAAGGGSPLNNINSTVYVSSTAGGTGKAADVVLSAQHSAGGAATSIMLSKFNTSRSIQIRADSLQFNDQNIWHAGNLTPGNYAPLAGATFIGAVSFNNTVALGADTTVAGIIKFTTTVPEPAYSSIPNGQIWLYMYDGGSGTRVLKARGKGAGGGQAQFTILTTGA